MNELEHIISEDSHRTPYTPKETTMTKDTGHRIIETPKESSSTVVVITWESGMVNVYRKDSKELLDTLIHEHEMIYEVQEAEMIS
jgi:phosphodiesterase/alkaline phosphatase D-like protein